MLHFSVEAGVDEEEDGIVTLERFSPVFFGIVEAE
jgi:hypothetical protein